MARRAARHADTVRWRGIVLSDVDLALHPGRITAVLGGPGSGKTVIARALTGRLPATARVTGEVLLDGTVGHLPQDGVEAFAPDRTVGDQLHELANRHRAWCVAEACAAAGTLAEVAACPEPAVQMFFRSAP